MKLIRAAGLSALAATLLLGGVPSTVGAAPTDPRDNLTFHRDKARTGWYSNETKLTPATVRPGNFGIIKTLQIAGKSYGQPLYVANQTVVKNGVSSTANLVIVATAADQLYAFEDKNFTLVWQRDFVPATANPISKEIEVPQFYTDIPCYDVNPLIGIHGTPVIDRSLGKNGRLYVVVASKSQKTGMPFMRLHAVSLATGADDLPPVDVKGAISGTAFRTDPGHNFARSALLEANGSIYVSLAGHCDAFAETTHGWVVSYSAKDLTKTGDILNTTVAGDGNNYFLGSPWMGGFGPAADEQGNVYFATGNGGTTNPPANFGMSVVKVPGNLNLGVVDFFQPPTAAQDSINDEDLGSGGVMLLPIPNQGASAPRLLIQGGKCQNEAAHTGCMKYILNRDAMKTPVWQADVADDMFGGPAYFFGSDNAPHVVYGGEKTLTTYTVQLSPVALVPQSVATSPVSELVSTRRCFECRTPGGSQPVVSSNGSADAIVWAVQTPDGNKLTPKFPAGKITLYALDALHMSNPPLFSGQAGVWTIYTAKSGQPQPRWIGGAFLSPLIADGRVYVPTDGALAVFGLGAPSGNPTARVGAVPPRYTALLAAQRPVVVPPSELVGTIASVSGNTFVLTLDDGSRRNVDATRAAKSGAFSAPLFVGKRVLVDGIVRKDGTFDASALSRITGVFAPPAKR